MLPPSFFFRREQTFWSRSDSRVHGKAKLTALSHGRSPSLFNKRAIRVGLMSLHFDLPRQLSRAINKQLSGDQFRAIRLFFFFSFFLHTRGKWLTDILSPALDHSHAHVGLSRITPWDQTCDLSVCVLWEMATIRRYGYLTAWNVRTEKVYCNEESRRLRIIRNCAAKLLIKDSNWNNRIATCTFPSSLHDALAARCSVTSSRIVLEPAKIFYTPTPLRLKF